MPKKNASNGFFMFRNHIKNEKRKDGRYLPDEEVTRISGELWENLDDATKDEWKSKAKEQKLQSRSVSASNYAVGNNSYPTSSAPQTSSARQMPNTSPKAASVVVKKPQSTKPARILAQQESVFQTWEDLELLQNPEKRRSKDRNDFENAFTWKYGKNVEELKTQRFYFLSASVLHHTSDGNCVPAEVACVEFTLKDGVTKSYCVPIKALECCNDSDIRKQIKDNKLEIIGVKTEEVARQLIDMTHKREPSCQNVRFFILNTELRPVFSCLSYLLINSDVAERYKNMTLKDVATVDDLAYGLFKFFDVKYPRVPVPPFGAPQQSSAFYNRDAVEFSYFIDLVDGQLCRRPTCDIHNEYDVDAPVCCLSRLCLVAEIIRTCVTTQEFSQERLTEYARRYDTTKAHYYHSPVLSAENSIYAEEKESAPVSFDDDDGEEKTDEVETKENEEEEEEYVEEMFHKAPRENFNLTNEPPREKTFTPPTEKFASFGDAEEVVAVVEEFRATTINNVNPVPPTTTIQQQPPSINPFTPYTSSSSSVNGNVGNATTTFEELVDPTYGYGNAFLRPPDTLSVQHLLPSGRRGFGRGIGLTNEGQLLQRMKFFKDVSS